MYFFDLLAAKIAASLHKLAISAPLKPGVRVDNLLAYSSIVISGSSFKGLRWIIKISFLPLISGSVTSIVLSNLPGLVRAGSSNSGLLVAARTTTLVSVPKPSISTRSWFKVLSFSSFPPSLASLFLPMASISSMKMIAGACSLAFLNRSLTLEAPTPTNISTKSEPEIYKKGTPASPAAALASKVLPVPGGPAKRAPLGILAPKSLNLFGFLRKSTNSVISTLASSKPATSLNLTGIFLSRPKI
mmetsp:Transcript_36672/g.32871  ORF Transcript_36672/g.32871 Transcript_36672/m.32871 type:complete len:245 (+) Transcript_36672:884-1618(+)